MANPSTNAFDPNGYILIQNFRKRKGYDPKGIEGVLKFTGPKYERMNWFQKCFSYLKLQRYFWAIHLTTYFMDNTEATIFLGLLAMLCILFCFAGYYYLPFYVSYCANKLVEYFPSLNVLPDGRGNSL
jgi:hypothetical protein